MKKFIILQDISGLTAVDDYVGTIEAIDFVNAYQELKSYLESIDIDCSKAALKYMDNTPYLEYNGVDPSDVEKVYYFIIEEKRI